MIEVFEAERDTIKYQHDDFREHGIIERQAFAHEVVEAVAEFHKHFGTSIPQDSFGLLGTWYTDMVRQTYVLRLRTLADAKAIGVPLEADLIRSELKKGFIKESPYKAMQTNRGSFLETAVAVMKAGIAIDEEHLKNLFFEALESNQVIPLECFEALLERDLVRLEETVTAIEGLDNKNFCSAIALHAAEKDPSLGERVLYGGTDTITFHYLNEFLALNPIITDQERFEALCVLILEEEIDSLSD